MINGISIATAGIFYAALRKCASYEQISYHFDALTAILLGGVSLNGGKGSIGTFGGVLVYGILNKYLFLDRSWDIREVSCVQGIVFIVHRMVKHTFKQKV